MASLQFSNVHCECTGLGGEKGRVFRKDFNDGDEISDL